jgi:hypothetical protein
MVGGDHIPATLFGEVEHVHKVRVGNAEQGVDTFGLEELQNALIYFYRHIFAFAFGLLFVCGNGRAT